MSPTKYCNVIQCTDCIHYQNCLQHEIEVNRLKGKPLPEIKIIEILNDEHQRRNEYE